MTDHTDLRRIAEAATRGPWKWEEPSTDPWPQSDQSLVTDYIPDGEQYRATVLMGWGYDASGTEASDEDRAFIAAAHPGTVLALLDEIDALRAERGPVVVDDAMVEHYCEVMHDAYEAAAVTEGWSTQEASRKPWADVPEANKRTMRVAVRAVLAAALTPDGQETGE